MATCIQTIQDGGEFETLFPNTASPFTINLLTNKVYRFSVSAASQVQFSFTFSPLQPVTTVAITVSILRQTGTTITEIGAAAFGDLIGGYGKDLPAGDYFLCIRTNQSYNGTVIGQFSGFRPQVNFQFFAAEGQTMSGKMDDRRPPVACDEPLFYELIDGTLPPGIKLTGLGRLNGVLPNLDCLEDAPDYSPAQNWSYFDPDGIAHPWGRVWRFKVRVSMADAAEAFDEEWFCIRVHNNWDFDRDNFLRNAPFKTVSSITITEEPDKLPGTFCMEPCVEPIESVFVPQPIGGPVCPVCDDADVVTDIQLIAIPPLCQKIDVNAIPLWWIRNKDVVFECKETAKFMENLKESAYFQALLKQAGYYNVPADPNLVVEATAFRNFLQLSASTLVDGRNADDIDAMMLQWKNQQNQRLPTSGDAWDGIHMSVEIK